MEKEDKSKEISFYLNSNEVDEYNKFIKDHRGCTYSSTIGGKISVTFTPTGLGVITVVRCNACGEEKDITDISNW